MPDGHQQPADIGVAEAERAVLVGELSDAPSRGTAPSSRRFRARRSTAGIGVLIGRDVEHWRPSGPCRGTASRFSEARLQAVSSRNMYSEHGLDARIGPGGAGVPVVDRRVELDAPDRRRPRRRGRSAPTDRGPSASCATVLPSVRRSGSSRRRPRRRAGTRP